MHPFRTLLPWTPVPTEQPGTPPQTCFSELPNLLPTANPYSEGGISATRPVRVLQSTKPILEES